jgi:hypothetical protein
MSENQPGGYYYNDTVEDDEVGMSAIEFVIQYHLENCTYENCTVSEAATIELGQLRADIARAAYEQRMTDARKVYDWHIEIESKSLVSVLMYIWRDIAGADAERKT